MSLVKNPILSILQSMIGISPTPGPVVLDDDSISLTLPVVPHVTRRSLAGIRTGWYQGVLENVHSAGDDEQSTLDPYNALLTAAAPYPANVPEDFDVWLLQVTMLRVSGSGGLTEGWVRIGLPPESIGLGVEDDGTVVTASSNYTLARFTDIIAAPGGLSNDMAVDANGNPVVHLNLRLPRNATINFASTSAAAATFRALLTLGLFPAALGQDVVA